MWKPISFVKAAVTISTLAILVAAPIAQAETVKGAHLHIDVSWNNGKTDHAQYQAPSGHHIMQAIPVVSNTNSEFTRKVIVSNDRRTATLIITCKGKGSFVNQVGGNCHGYLSIQLD